MNTVQYIAGNYPGNIKRKFVGKADEFIDINLIKPLPYNKTIRSYQADPQIQQRQGLKNSIIENGLRVPPRAFKASDGVIYSVGGNTRIEILKELGCTEVPIEWSYDLEGEDHESGNVRKAAVDDNTRVSMSISAKYAAACKDFDFNEKLTIDQKKSICEGLGWSLTSFREYEKLDKGYTNKRGERVEARTDLVGELEKGKVDSLTRQRKSQDTDHRVKLNSKNNDHPRNPELEKVFESIDGVKLTKALKTYLEKLNALQIDGYDGGCLTCIDKQGVGQIFHSTITNFFSQDINNSQDKFILKPEIDNANYDIYVNDIHGNVISSIEVKTTQGSNWTSNKPKGGYVLLAGISKELNFFVNISYIKQNAWTGGVKGNFDLKPITLGSYIDNNEFSYNYYGKLYKDDGKWKIFKDII